MICNPKLSSIFKIQDGESIGSPLCYLVNNQVVKYAMKYTASNGATAVTFVDENGVESATLPAGAKQINCDDVVYVGNQADGENPAGTSFVLHLVDYVPERIEGGTVETVFRSSSTPTLTKRILFGSPFSEPFPNSIFWNADGLSSGEVYANISVVSGSTYTIFPATSKSNAEPLNVDLYLGSQSLPFVASYYDGYQFVANVTGSVEVGLRINESSGYDGLNDFYVEGLVGATVFPASCTPFIRIVTNGAFADYDANDGVTPYVVQGQPLKTCPVN